jgi:hypothetical protein
VVEFCARKAAKWMAVVVFPTPPLKDATVMITLERIQCPGYLVNHSGTRSANHLGD